MLDEVVILEIAGRITLGEGASYFRDLITRTVIRGDKWILADLSEVSYVDSSGIGELVSTFTTVYNAGGQLKLVNIVKRVRDLLQNTKLYTIFDVFEDQTAAIRSFRGGLRYTYCPLCLRFRTRPPTEAGGEWPPQTCMLCDSEFVVNSGACADGRLAVTKIKIRTYLDEYLRIEPGPFYRVNFAGRLNRFSCSFLRNAWRALPSARRVIFVVDELTEVADSAPAALGELLADVCSGEDRAVVMLEGRQTRLLDSFLPFLPAYTDKESALRAMQGISEAGPWCVPVKEQ